jgi:hypothetical protein
LVGGDTKKRRVIRASERLSPDFEFCPIFIFMSQIKRRYHAFLPGYKDYYKF